MAITDLTGTKWVLNSSLSIGAFSGQTPRLNLQFNCNDVIYNYFEIDGDEKYDNFNGLYYEDDGTLVYNFNTNTWTNQAYRIIEITGGTDATSSDLISWLMANATQVPVADLTGTEWLLNSSLTLGSSNLNYDIEFESNSTNYYFLKIYDSDYDDNPPQSLAYGTDLAYYNGSWVNGASRTIEITGGTDVSDPNLLVWLTANAEYQEPEPEPTGVKNILFGTQAIDKILFGQSEVSKIYLGQTLVYEAGSEPPTPTVDPVLGNNDWATIKAVCEAGQAADYWNVGDTKNVTAGGYTRPVMIVDMSHGRTVFMFRNRTENNYVWQPTAIDGYYNNYSTSQMRSTHLASGGAIETALVDAELSAVLTASSYKVATNGNDGTLLTLSDQLWLPAEKELTQTRAYSVQAEFDALTTFDYFIANDHPASRVCHKASAPTATSGNVYWERSPSAGNANYVCRVNSVGNLDSADAGNSTGVAPCFAFTPTN